MYSNLFTNIRNIGGSVLTRKLLAPVAIATSIFAASTPATAAPSIRPVAPAVFGSVALRITQSPFQREWGRIAAAPLGGEGQSLIAAARNAGSRLAQVEAVNKAVNNRLTYREDSRLFGTADHWATPTESLARRAGDCEDYAILKRAALRAIGVPDSDMYLVILRDLAVRADHAVLAVRIDGKTMILDNRNNQLSSDAGQSDYRPIFSFNSQGAWTHGYARQPALPAIQLAAATQTAVN